MTPAFPSSVGFHSFTRSLVAVFNVARSPVVSFRKSRFVAVLRDARRSRARGTAGLCIALSALAFFAFPGRSIAPRAYRLESSWRDVVSAHAVPSFAVSKSRQQSLQAPSRQRLANGFDAPLASSGFSFAAHTRGGLGIGAVAERTVVSDVSARGYDATAPPVM